MFDDAEINLDSYFMRRALFLARQAFEDDEVPIGAVIVHNNKIIAEGYNQIERLKDATAHAEMVAITAAESVIENWRLSECTLYVTIEPCMMCSGALMLCRMGRIVFGAKDPRMGFLVSNYDPVKSLNLFKNVKIESGLLENEAGGLMQEFFQKLRDRRK